MTPTQQLVNPEIRWEDPKTRNIPPVDWLVDDLVARGGISLIYGDPGAGKSVLGLWIAMTVAAGIKFAGRPEKGSEAVLYLGGDSGLQILNSHLSKFEVGLGLSSSPDKVLHISAHQDVEIGTDEGIALLKASIVEHGYNLVIVDTLITYKPHDAESNDYDAMSKMLSRVRREICEVHGTSFLFFHHTNKSGGFMASMAFMGSVDMFFKMARDDSNTTTIRCEKSKIGDEPDPLSFQWTNTPGMVGGKMVTFTKIPVVKNPSVPAAVQAQTKLRSVLAFLDLYGTNDGWANMTQIRTGLSGAGVTIGKEKLAEILDDLSQTGRVEFRVGDLKNAHEYRASKGATI